MTLGFGFGFSKLHWQIKVFNFIQGNFYYLSLQNNIMDLNNNAMFYKQIKAVDLLPNQLQGKFLLKQRGIWKAGQPLKEKKP